VKRSEWVFTFGRGHRHPETSACLERRFVAIRAETYEEARLLMVRHFGRAWCGQYASRSEAGVDEFELRELVRDDWPAPQPAEER
jgi:hypothetical protein